jgi:hypothetical protein
MMSVPFLLKEHEPTPFLFLVSSERGTSRWVYLRRPWLSDLSQLGHCSLSVPCALAVSRGVSSDRRAQQQRRGKWELIAKGSALTGSKRDEVCPLSNGTGHWRLPGGCSIVTGSRCVIHQLVRRDRRANLWSS